jgi:hypothetical protein
MTVYLFPHVFFTPPAPPTSLLQPESSPQFIELHALFEKSVAEGTATRASVEKMTEYGEICALNWISMLL